MKVVYVKGNDYRVNPGLPNGIKDALVLGYNNWDDYSYKTTLNASLYHNGEFKIGFHLKVLVESVDFTAKYFNEKIESGWDGFFPIEEKYISVSEDVDLYSVVSDLLGYEEGIEFFNSIGDASFLKNVKGTVFDEYEEWTGLKTSLLREAGGRKSFADGWSIFLGNESSIKSFSLCAESPKDDELNFFFDSGWFPSDINILVGPNGIGKSFKIKALSEYWLGVGLGEKKELSERGFSPFDNYPNISQLILCSYSPFEDFKVSLHDSNLLNEKAYKYFGFRALVDDGSRIKISRHQPIFDAVDSLIKIIEEDSKFSFLSSWIGKMNLVSETLKHCVQFDHLALEVKEEFANEFPGVYRFRYKGKCYLRVDDSSLKIIYSYGERMRELIDYSEGVVFFKGDEKVGLSSGQRLFMYMVINIIGYLRKDSLVLIDEPELFLHPTLELKFISMLKQVLDVFNSKSVMATHSPVLVREVPSACVFVFRDVDGNRIIQNPPFETFGGNLQKISSYVFGDNTSEKPFEIWLDSKIDEFHGSREHLIEELGAKASPELISRILNYKGGINE